MRRITAAVIGLVLSLSLSSCGEDKLDGKVTDKDARAGYYVTIIMPIVSGKTTTYVPILYWIPPCFQITVKGSTSGDTCIDEGRWESIQVGDAYVGPDVDPRDRKVKR